VTFPQLINATRQTPLKCPVLLYLENHFAVIQVLSKKIIGIRASQEIFIKFFSSEILIFITTNIEFFQRRLD